MHRSKQARFVPDGLGFGAPQGCLLSFSYYSNSSNYTNTSNNSNSNCNSNSSNVYIN